MKTKPYDELYRRQHRIVGNYLALHAWLRGVDCVVLDRKDLQALFHITNTGEDRIKQFQMDIEPWFKFSKPYYRPKSRTFVRSLFLSRIDFSSYLLKGQMTTEDRISKIRTGDPPLRIERFENWIRSSKFPTERKMISTLVAFATGISDPKV